MLKKIQVARGGKVSDLLRVAWSEWNGHFEFCHVLKGEDYMKMQSFVARMKLPMIFSFSI